MKIKRIIKVTRYKAGYEVRNVVIDGKEFGMTDTKMRMAYTPNGDYIGSPKDARFLVAQKGIQPQLRTKDSSVCSIGYSVNDGKWYGWSHRAIHGFKVGSKCKRGDCGYIPFDKDDFLAGIVNFWTKTGTKTDVKGKHTAKGVKVSWIYRDNVPNPLAMKGTISGCLERYPDSYGKGEWIAITTADAKQMAVDFAAGVS